MNKEIIQKTIIFVKKELKSAEKGHDWWHIYRVWSLAQKIAKKEKGNLFIVEIGALLHDIADSKFHDGDEEKGPNKAREFLQSLHIPSKDVQHIENIIRHISFKGENHTQQFRSPELDIVQDADRLDAMGALGIARCFHYGGYKNREIYNPEIPPQINMSKEEYKKNRGTAINHFYEKLLLLKNKMNTKTGKKMAEKRHIFMENYLKEFKKEWQIEK